MSDIITDTSVSRPWRGSDSPFEALHDWMIRELDAIKTAANPTIKALEARIAELEKGPGSAFPTVPAASPVAMSPVEPPLPAVGEYVSPTAPAVEPAPQSPTLDPVTEPAPSAEPSV